MTHITLNPVEGRSTVRAEDHPQNSIQTNTIRKIATSIFSNAQQRTGKVISCFRFSAGLPNEKKLIKQITNGMNQEDRKSVMNTINQIPPEKRLIFMNQVLKLIISMKNSSIRRQNAIQLARILPEEREEFIIQALRLRGAIKEEKDQHLAIKILATDIKSNHQQEFVTQVLQLIEPILNDLEKMAAIFTLSQISEPQEREIFIERAIQFGKHFESADKTAAILFLNEIPSGKREEFINQFSMLIQHITDLSLKDIFNSWLLQTSVVNRQQFVAEALKAISHGSTSEHKEEILSIIIEIAPENLQSVIHRASLRFHAEQQVWLSTEEEQIERFLVLLSTPLNLPFSRIGIEAEELIVDVQTLSIEPEKILFSLSKPMSVLNDLPGIRYRIDGKIDKIGIDVGGITRDFLTKFFESLCHRDEKKRELSIVDDEEGILLGRREGNELDLEYLVSIGKIFAMALQNIQSIKIGNHFHPTLFQMIHSLTQKEVDLGTSPDLYKKLLFICLKGRFSESFGPSDMSKISMSEVEKEEWLLAAGMKDKEQFLNDLKNRPIALAALIRERAISQFVEDKIVPKWMAEYGLIETCEEFIKEQKVDEIIWGAVHIARSMVGLLPPNQWNQIKGNSPTYLRDQIEGTLSKEQILNSLSFVGEDEGAKEHLIDWIEAATFKQLEHFAFAISGSVRLSANQKLTVSWTHDPSFLPAFHTCSFSIDLPKYSSAETLKTKLEMSLETIPIRSTSGIGGLA